MDGAGTTVHREVYGAPHRRGRIHRGNLEGCLRNRPEDLIMFQPLARQPPEFRFTISVGQYKDGRTLEVKMRNAVQSSSRSRPHACRKNAGPVPHRCVDSGHRRRRRFIAAEHVTDSPLRRRFDQLHRTKAAGNAEDSFDARFFKGCRHNVCLSHKFSRQF
jgi:hypothetical protein